MAPRALWEHPSTTLLLNHLRYPILTNPARKINFAL